MKHDTGSYAATAMGFVLGSVGGGLLVGFIGAYVPIVEGLDGIVVLLLEVVVGAVIGSMLAVWGLLRACEYALAGSTALITGIAWIPIGLILAVMAALMGNGVVWVVPIVVVVLSCAARWAALAGAQ